MCTAWHSRCCRSMRTIRGKDTDRGCLLPLLPMVMLLSAKAVSQLLSAALPTRPTPAPTRWPTQAQTGRRATHVVEPEHTVLHNTPSPSHTLAHFVPLRRASRRERGPAASARRRREREREGKRVCSWIDFEAFLEASKLQTGRQAGRQADRQAGKLGRRRSISYRAT